MKLSTLRQCKSILKALLVPLVVLWVISWLYKPNIPTEKQVQPASLQDPVQTETNVSAFEYQRKGKSFWVEPTHDYSISGIVVSKNHMKSLIDPNYIKYDARIQDFCVVWGQNTQNQIMDRIKVRNSNFTCHFFAENQSDWDNFEMDQLSNNHILASDPAVIKKLKNIEVGDQITLSGQLANYYHDQGLKQTIRKTSTTRTDTGNGACETFFVDEVTILHKTTPVRSHFFRLIQHVFPWLMLGWIILWFVEIRLEVKRSSRRD